MLFRDGDAAVWIAHVSQAAPCGLWPEASFGLLT